MDESREQICKLEEILLENPDGRNRWHMSQMVLLACGYEPEDPDFDNYAFDFMWWCEHGYPDWLYDEIEHYVECGLSHERARNKVAKRCEDVWNDYLRSAIDGGVFGLFETYAKGSGYTPFSAGVSAEDTFA